MQDNYFPVISRAVSGVVLRVPVIYWKYWRNFSFGQFGSICAWSGIRLEILLRFWWEWYFWKWHNPTITQILDFCLYNVYCSVNLKKHWLRTLLNFWWKWAKIVEKYTLIHFKVSNEPLLIAKWFFLSFLGHWFHFNNASEFRNTILQNVLSACLLNTFNLDT